MSAECRDWATEHVRQEEVDPPSHLNALWGIVIQSARIPLLCNASAELILRRKELFFSDSWICDSAGCSAETNTWHARIWNFTWFQEKLYQWILGKFILLFLLFYVCILKWRNSSIPSFLLELVPDCVTFCLYPILLLRTDKNYSSLDKTTPHLS